MFSKLLKLAIVSLPFLTRVSAWDTNIATVVNSFNEADIPQDIYITFDPDVLFDITWPQTSGPSVELTTGETILRNETAIPVTWALSSSKSVSSSEPFVIAMVDPDVPTPTNNSYGQFRHFLGGNFYASSGDNGFYSLHNTTPAITEYYQPTPPEGSPPHRYIFLLFEQPSDFNSQTYVTSTTTQFYFNISLFAQETNLGNPIGGAFAYIGPDNTSQPFNP